MSLNWFTEKESSTDNVEVNKGKEPIVEISERPQEDKFWIDFGENIIKDTIQTLDERAKYIITTCASLIVIHFGLLLAFKVQGLSFKVTPEFFFVVSAALFALSFYPIRKDVIMQSPSDIRDAYKYWINWRQVWHRVGFGFFIAGLLAMAITITISPPSSDQSIQIINGNKSLVINATSYIPNSMTTSSSSHVMSTHDQSMNK